MFVHLVIYRIGVVFFSLYIASCEGARDRIGQLLCQLCLVLALYPFPFTNRFASLIKLAITNTITIVIGNAAIIDTSADSYILIWNTTFSNRCNISARFAPAVSEPKLPLQQSRTNVSLNSVMPERRTVLFSTRFCSRILKAVWCENPYFSLTYSGIHHIICHE